jgi:regulator of protease activity HflC (stomatin/prohibitin superfamily)
MTLDEVFQSKSTIANQVSKHLKTVMEYYGYEIFKALVTDVKPADAVRQAMNEINASKRLKIAMVYLADAEMTRIRKNAEAHAEDLYLQGVGVSGQRQAIVKGLVSSLDAVENHGISNAEVMNLLLVTQYNDLLQAVSLNKTNTSNFVLPLL